MNIRNTLVTGLAAVALTAASARSSEILANSGGFNAGYSDGDLVLAFMNNGDSSANGNVLFDLGSASSFTGLAAGTYSVAGFNGSSTAGQSAVGFGSSEINANETVPSSATFWSVMGSIDTGTPKLWLTSTTTQPQQSASTQQTVADNIYGIGNAGVGGVNVDGSAFDSAQTAGDFLLQNEKWQGFSGLAAVPVSPTSNSLNLYALLPGVSGGGSSTLLGTFTLTDTAGAFSLSFTPFTAIPEPSTYAAILGALTVGFVLVRRRYGASRLNALA